MFKVTSKFAKKNVDYEFSSTQIDLSADLVKRLKNWGTKHIATEDVYTEEKKYGREDEIHVTIKYGLHTANAEDVKNVLKNFGSFDITLGNISRFAPPSKEYDVVKLEIESQRLHDLHSLLGEKLKNSDEWPEYRPHVTFAYIKKGTCSQLSGDSTFKGEEVKIKEITFSSKNGNKETIQMRKKV